MTQNTTQPIRIDKDELIEAYQRNQWKTENASKLVCIDLDDGSTEIRVEPRNHDLTVNPRVLIKEDHTDYRKLCDNDPSQLSESDLGVWKSAVYLRDEIPSYVTSIRRGSIPIRYE